MLMRPISKFGLAALPLAACLILAPAFAQVPPGPADERLPDAHETEPGSPTPGAWRASQLIGQTMTTALNQSVGTVNDIVIDTDGKVAAVLVGIGGFLGMGERTVPIALRHLIITPREGDRISVETSLTREAIDQAATHDPFESPLSKDQRLP